MSRTLKTAIPFIILVVFAGTSIAPLLSVNSINGLTPDFENTISLQNTDGTATGTATRSYKENSYNITISADLTAPTEGNHYESWIVRLSPFKITDIGQMAKGEDGTWNLTYTESNIETDYTEFSTVIVTEEIGVLLTQNELDNTGRFATIGTETPTIPSETHVLEGTF